MQNYHIDSYPEIICQFDPIYMIEKDMNEVTQVVSKMHHPTIERESKKTH